VSDSPGEILFMRVPPTGLVKPVGGGGRCGSARLAAVFAREGFRGRIGERNITCFWIGMGRRVRVPGRKLLERIRSGAITEIIDIGCAGALDSGLGRGDLVLSSDDIAFDSDVPVAVSRRPELEFILQEVAADRGVTLRRAPILTHERFVSSRADRIELFERTGCFAVQMEHVWFLQLLQSLLPDRTLDIIRFTQIVLITDAVPSSGSRGATARSNWDALTGYAFPGGSGGIMSLRRQILSRWPSL
jgi:purine-nucleoside phosphorylase